MTSQIKKLNLKRKINIYFISDLEILTTLINIPSKMPSTRIKDEFDTSLYKIDNIRVLLNFLESSEDESVKKLYKKIQPIYDSSIQKLKAFFDEINKENKQLIEKYTSRCSDETKTKLTNLVDEASITLMNEDVNEQKNIVKQILNASVAPPHDWKVGSLLEARDRSKNGYDWYLSKIIEIKGRKCKVHFKNWNQRFDKWYEMNSADLRPWHEATELEKNSKFKVGDKVLAKNPDEEQYLPCRIDQMKTDNDSLYYSVLFYEMEFLRFLVKCEDVKELTDENIERINVDTFRLGNDLLNETKMDNENQECISMIKQGSARASIESSSNGKSTSLKRKRSQCSEAEENVVDLSLDVKYINQVKNVKYSLTTHPRNQMIL